MKKKYVCMAAALIISLSACGGQASSSDSGAADSETTKLEETTIEETTTEAETKEETEYTLGDTVSTDILEFTLDKADLTIALQNALDENYFLPKEYDSTEDSKNPFVAAKWHTFVAFTFTAKNLDRASVTPYEYGDVSDFISVIYDGKSYTSDIEYGFRNDNDEGWRTDGGSSLQIVLLPGEQTSRRCYIDIPVEVTDLSDTFSIKFNLPGSGGERVDYVYTVTPERK